MKPSDFANKFPYDSVWENYEIETVAINIMKILRRTGDTWRRLSWREYRTERLADQHLPNAGFSDMEKGYFERAVEYTDTEGHARQFSPAWR